jgi:hypothetical protein
MPPWERGFWWFSISRDEQIRARRLNVFPSPMSSASIPPYTELGEVSESPVIL